MALFPLLGPLVGIIYKDGTPSTPFYGWLKALFDTVSGLVSALAAQFPAGAAVTTWTSYSPTVTAGAGTFTTVSATGSYYRIGKTVFLKFTVTITTIGTASGDLIVTVPITPIAADQYIGGRETVLGAALTGTVEAADLKAHINRYDPTTTLMTSNRIAVCGGFYEAA